MEHVLTLNANYVAIAIVTFKRAIRMLCAGRAEVVEAANNYYENYSFSSWAELSAFKVQNNIANDYDRVLYTENNVIIVPTIIRTLYYDKVNFGKVKMTRKNIYARDKYTCGYCGKKFSTEHLNIDHVIPKSRGGRNEWTNVICSCIKCNSRKNNLTPKEAGMKLLRAPFEPRESFTLNCDISYKRYFKTWGEFIDNLYFNRELEE